MSSIEETQEVLQLLITIILDDKCVIHISQPQLRPYHSSTKSFYFEFLHEDVRYHQGERRSHGCPFLLLKELITVQEVRCPETEFCKIRNGGYIQGCPLLQVRVLRKSSPDDL